MEESPAIELSEAKALRWPRELGAVGCVLALLMFLDHLGDLGPLSWSHQKWVEMVGADLADTVIAMLNPNWIIPTSLFGMALAIYLLMASINLRRQRRLGVLQSRVWSWLAIALLAVETFRGAIWIIRNPDTFAALNALDGSTEWYEYILGAVVIAVLLYPVFLLVFLSRPSIRAQYAGWPA